MTKIFKRWLAGLVIVTLALSAAAATTGLSAVISGGLYAASDSSAGFMASAHYTKVANAASTDAQFGDGADGDIVSGAGTTTLTRDSYYQNVTLGAGDEIRTTSYRLFIRGTLDLSAADADAIRNIDLATGNAGATAGTAGALKNGCATNTLGGTSAGAAGGAGGTAGGTTGTAAASTPVGQGGRSGASGAGGLGASGAGGGLAAGASFASAMSVHRPIVDCVRGATIMLGGASGAGGGGGGGDGTAGGGGGSGGASGGIVWVSARTIARGTNTNAGIISVTGGAGGAGGAATAGNRGGGGGGSGAGGGWIYLAYLTTTGSAITNALDASGGNGGVGGNGFGTGVGGNQGTGGAGGRITIGNLLTGTFTETFGSAGASGTAGSGVTGGTGGGAGNTLLASL